MGYERNGLEEKEAEVRVEQLRLQRWLTGQCPWRDYGGSPSSRGFPSLGIACPLASARAAAFFLSPGGADSVSAGRLPTLPKTPLDTPAISICRARERITLLTSAHAPRVAAGWQWVTHTCVWKMTILVSFNLAHSWYPREADTDDLWRVEGQRETQCLLCTLREQVPSWREPPGWAWGVFVLGHPLWEPSVDRQMAFKGNTA